MTTDEEIVRTKVRYLQKDDVLTGSHFTVTGSVYVNGRKAEVVGMYPNGKIGKVYWNADTTVSVFRKRS